MIVAAGERLLREKAPQLAAECCIDRATEPRPGIDRSAFRHADIDDRALQLDENRIPKCLVGERLSEGKLAIQRQGPKGGEGFPRRELLPGKGESGQLLGGGRLRLWLRRKWFSRKKR